MCEDEPGVRRNSDSTYLCRRWHAAIYISIWAYWIKCTLGGIQHVKFKCWYIDRAENVRTIRFSQYVNCNWLRVRTIAITDGTVFDEAIWLFIRPLLVFYYNFCTESAAKVDDAKSTYYLTTQPNEEGGLLHRPLAYVVNWFGQCLLFPKGFQPNQIAKY